MNKFIYFTLIFIITSCQKETASNPSDYLSKEEVKSFKYKIVRYYERLPKKADHETKWDTTYNDYYTKKATATDLIHYYKNDDGYIYFAVAKIAPSLKIKKVAIAGHLKYDNNGQIVFYEEGFRTWKMEPKELEQKTKLLFTKYINKEDLSDYYTINSNPEFFIEFPDQFTIYDTISRVWKRK